MVRLLRRRKSRTAVRSIRRIATAVKYSRPRSQPFTDQNSTGAKGPAKGTSISAPRFTSTSTPKKLTVEIAASRKGMRRGVGMYG